MTSEFVSDDKIEVNCCGVVEHFTGYTCVAKKIQPDSEDYSTPTKKNGVAYAVGSFMTVSPRSVQNHPGLRAVAGCTASGDNFSSTPLGLSKSMCDNEDVFPYDGIVKAVAVAVPVSPSKIDRSLSRIDSPPRIVNRSLEENQTKIEPFADSTPKVEVSTKLVEYFTQAFEQFLSETPEFYDLSSSSLINKRQQVLQQECEHSKVERELQAQLAKVKRSQLELEWKLLEEIKNEQALKNEKGMLLRMRLDAINSDPEAAQKELEVYEQFRKTNMGIVNVDEAIEEDISVYSKVSRNYSEFSKNTASSLKLPPQLFASPSRNVSDKRKHSKGSSRKLEQKNSSTNETDSKISQQEKHRLALANSLLIQMERDIQSILNRNESSFKLKK